MLHLTRRAVLGASGVLAVFAARAVWAAGQNEQVALKGYDPVAYFTVGHPDKGSADFVASYDGVTYWFKNANDRALFVADPDRYAPQYDGYCAVTVSRGGKYEADPEAWKIADGKLYVFGAKDLVGYFQEHATSVIAKADANWPGLRSQGRP
jgi:YHS domain-containing protein